MLKVIVRSFIDRSMGVPREVGSTITRNIITSLRQHFLGVTFVAAFSGVVVGALAAAT